MPAPYNDLFNEAIDDLAATLATITGLPVATDPRRITPGCVFIDAPSFTAFNYNIVTMIFSIKVIAAGPGNLDALRELLQITAKVLAKNVAITAGNPALVAIGGAEYPAYDLSLSMQAQTA